jgi:hypothetical protein
MKYKQFKSNAYHPESQGALERFHQTLKNVMNTFCFDSHKDWDNGEMRNKIGSLISQNCFRKTHKSKNKIVKALITDGVVFYNFTIIYGS